MVRCLLKYMSLAASFILEGMYLALLLVVTLFYNLSFSPKEVT